jgi:trehalose utilization protein
LIPEFLDDADILIVLRPFGEPWDGFSLDPVIETPPSPDPFMTDELESYLVDSVKNRGMGFLGLHCTGGGSGPRRVRLQELLGMNNDKVHAPLQETLVHSFNQAHPITEGMKEFRLDREEPFYGDLTDKPTPLYKVTALNNGEVMTNGWCLEQGKGRIVMIRLGHYYQTLRDARVRELHWRAAHWALRREIPPFNPGSRWSW